MPRTRGSRSSPRLQPSASAPPAGDVRPPGPSGPTPRPVIPRPTGPAGPVAHTHDTRQQSRIRPSTTHASHSPTREGDVRDTASSAPPSRRHVRPTGPLPPPPSHIPTGLRPERLEPAPSASVRPAQPSVHSQAGHARSEGRPGSAGRPHHSQRAEPFVFQPGADPAQLMQAFFTSLAQFTAAQTGAGDAQPARDPFVLALREFERHHTPQYDGSGGYDAAEEWLAAVQTTFRLSRTPTAHMTELANTLLVRDARHWWVSYEPKPCRGWRGELRGGVGWAWIWPELAEASEGRGRLLEKRKRKRERNVVGLEEKEERIASQLKHAKFKSFTASKDFLQVEMLSENLKYVDFLLVCWP